MIDINDLKTFTDILALAKKCYLEIEVLPVSNSIKIKTSIAVSAKPLVEIFQSTDVYHIRSFMDGYYSAMRTYRRD
jgi:hypothetical protein